MTCESWFYNIYMNVLAFLIFRYRENISVFSLPKNKHFEECYLKIWLWKVKFYWVIKKNYKKKQKTTKLFNPKSQNISGNPKGILS